MILRTNTYASDVAVPVDSGLAQCLNNDYSANLRQYSSVHVSLLRRLHLEIYSTSEYECLCLPCKVYQCRIST